MKVCIGVLRHVIVEDNVDTLDVHASTKQVGGHKDTLLEILELLVSGQPEIQIIIIMTFKCILFVT